MQSSLSLFGILKTGHVPFFGLPTTAFLERGGAGGMWPFNWQDFISEEAVVASACWDLIERCLSRFSILCQGFSNIPLFPDGDRPSKYASLKTSHHCSLASTWSRLYHLILQMCACTHMQSTWNFTINSQFANTCKAKVSHGGTTLKLFGTNFITSPYWTCTISKS